MITLWGGGRRMREAGRMRTREHAEAEYGDLYDHAEEEEEEYEEGAGGA